LQARLQQANEVQDFAKQREQQLREQLTQYGLGKQLTGMNKQVYYYQQQLSEYKSLLKDKDKLQQKILSVLRNQPAFQSFWQKNSYLAQLFPMPENYGTSLALAGLQTRDQLQGLITQQSGVSGANPSQYLEQQFQQAQSGLNKLKDKVNQLGGTSGSGDMTMPDFTVNNQHNKKFLQRLEYGYNIQTAQSSDLLPTTSDIAATAGFKVNDKITTGLGLSYVL
jgi:DNA repair exonuclease SbcCD ATPase subunit